MARPRPRGQVPAIPSNSLVASAVRLDRKVARIYHRNGSDWQRECYRHYAICGEARYAASYMGNAVAKAVLSVMNDKGEEVTSGPAVDALDNLFNGRQGQSQMLEEIGVHLTIAGECFLIGRQVKGGDIWEVVSVLEVQVNGGRWSILYGDQMQPVELTDSDVVIRIWKPLPGNRIEADSPFRSLLPILTEIEWLTGHVFSQIRSRLLGAGLLFLPSGMTFPPPPEVDGKAQEPANEAEAFMRTLAAAMEKALRREGNPSEIVPTIVMTDVEGIDKARLMDFWTSLDAESKELRNEAIRRFAQGMSLPIEEVLGMSSNPGTGGGASNGVSHWGAWQIEESTIKMHVEPMLDVIANSLTVTYIRPLLTDDSTERIGYNTSALRLRPDRSREAQELYNLGLIKGEIVVVENGFDTSDMMSDTELQQWFLKKIAGGSATPEQVTAALKELGIDLDIEPPPTPAVEAPRETRPDPSLEEHPSKPRTPDESSLVLACDALVLRAMELAGKRAINGGLRGKNRDKAIEPTEFHLENKVENPEALLEGAFTYAPKVLGDSPLIGVLNDYCSALIAAQAPHSRDNLLNYMDTRGVRLAPHMGTGQPINLNVNVAGATHEITVPDQKAPEVTLTPTFNLSPTFDMNTPDVHLNPTFKVDPNVTVNVEPTPVTVENHVEAGAAPEVNVTNEVNVPQVKAPDVKISPKVTAQVKIPKRKTVREVVRDENGDIAGSVETEEEV